MKSFLLKVKHFFRRNIYPITVTACTVLVLAIIAISAFAAISSNDGITPQGPSTPVVSDQSGGDKKEEEKPTQPTDPVVIEFVLPFEGASVSKKYTDDVLIEDRTTKSWRTHQGMDFTCKDGQKVVAVHDGTITKVEHTMMNGTVVYLKVSDTLTVVYKGLSSDVKVSEGEVVKAGAEIGVVTSFLTEKKDGIHLHLELLENEKLVDPTEYFTFNK